MSQVTTAVELWPIGSTRDKPTQNLQKTSSQTLVSLRDESPARSGPPNQPSQVSTPLPNGRVILVTTQLTLVGLVGSMSSGLLTVGIPRMAADLGLSSQLIYWPSSVYGLASGTCLLLAGAVADVIGKRLVNLVGCFLLGCFNLATGFAKTGVDLIVLRAIQGIAVSMCLPTAIGILSTSAAKGKLRNVGFACLGLSPALGFSIGLVLGGVFVDTVGWRVGYYICGAANLLLFFVGIWTLPADNARGQYTLTRLKSEIDWVGASIATACLGMLGYVLAEITDTTSSIKQPANIVLLILSVGLIPAFVVWVSRQEKMGKPALIRNAIWKNTAFTSICLMILLSYAVEQTMDLFSSLFFQQVQLLPALQASIRLLPSMALGVVLNFTTGLLVDRVPALPLILVSSILCAGAPLLMALINPQWPYWYDAFFAQLLEPLSAAFLFTVGVLVVSDSFPENLQAMAGAIFNTVAQFGTSIGLAIIAIISNAVTQGSNYRDKNSPDALLEGYRAGFWAAFGLMILTCCIGGIGLRRVGKVGLKTE